jgi:molecular chaperone HtpG
MSKHEIRINLPGLLRMLGENIYSDPEVAVREMIQNAHDGSIIRMTKQPDFKTPESALPDKAACTPTIAERTGMTEANSTRTATTGESHPHPKADLRKQQR